jgi:hypothetical protein
MTEAKKNSDDAVYPTDTRLATKSVRNASFAKLNDIVIPRLNDNAGVHSTLRKWYALEDENGYVRLICSAHLGANRLYGLYAEAHDACVKINTTLKDLNLSEEDQDLLASTNGTAFVLERLRDVEKQVLAKNGKETWLRQVKDWGNSFCKITTQFAGVIQIMVPQSPEYAVPVALLLALFKVYLAANAPHTKANEIAR